MSAFVVSNETVTGMLEGAKHFIGHNGLYYYWNDEVHYFAGHTKEIGQILVDENYKSVNYRYSEETPSHQFAVMPIRHLSHVEILKLCDCYTYQACETPDWEESEAYAIVQAIRARVIHTLPGYDEAPWGYRG